MSRKLGRFKVSKILILEVNSDEEWKALHALFSRVVPIHIIDNQYETDLLQYIAVSKDFEEVQLGSKIPFYEIILSRIDLKGKTRYAVKFKKTDDPEEFIFT